ncbi:hypothetical protein [Kribbella endophytica]
MTTLQLELARWENELETLENECTAEDWSRPERLMAAVRKTLAAYRRRILPRLKAEHDLVLPALPDVAAVAAVEAYDAIVEDELVQHVERLDDLRRELVRVGATAELELQIAESLAALRALTKVAVRFGRELEEPQLDQALTSAHASGLARAVRRYALSLR